MMTSRLECLLCFLLLISFFPRKSYAQNISFDFSTFSFRNLTLIGDAYLRNGAIGLTRDLAVPNSSAGRALYNKPVQLLDPKTNTSVSFRTMFSFSITNVDPVSFGEGLAFVITPDNNTVGSAGPFLGLVNASTQIDDTRTIAVEFDTFLDVQFHDPNANHIGLDIGNLTSYKVADVGILQIDLKSGDLITSWIDYNSTEKMARVWLSYSSVKPEKPLMSVSIDFSKYFNEYMYIGFSASTGGSTEVHKIEEWSFQSFGLSSPVVSPLPKNITTPKNITDPSIVGPVMSTRGGCHGGLCFSRLTLVGIISGSSVLFVLFFGFIAWFSYRKWKASRPSDSFRSDVMKSPKKFTYKELSIATKGFSTSRVIGHGAFGTVYRGVLPDSDNVVAVKRSTYNNQGKNEFIAELSIIGRLRHRNLVHLQGWCHEKGEFLLVFEYMPNGSLDKILFQEGQGPVLSWGHRYKIVMGVASALSYLHGEWEQQVIHRDIKASNIMLDASFNARLGDFGLARLMDHNKSPDATLTAGTMGYLAPEYLQSGKASEKTDVFSFGAVVLEVACGRRPIEKDLPSGKNNLVDWVWSLHSEGRLLEAADARLEGEYDEDEMTRMLSVGLLCSHPHSNSRPTMRQNLDRARVLALLLQA
ncbi:L-type lectin-domain containing receptor kinase VIII.1 [Cryptomeria japonica]|uniref:L-type lectin-domain containing receptor kinase VIII.1 n=1 Tax=Cryptomeria japonica TaxID=3369 RepID=UPI0025AC5AC1|nr:L-type lectin-domain containing receptor kinase VIII.1 [Cryptomeria japonica]